MGLLESRLKGATLRSSHALVVEELGRAIVSGAFPEHVLLPGDHDLMDRFHVSRTVLREAMKTLAAKRLIEAKSRVGTRVCARDRWNFVDPDVIGWMMRDGMAPDFVRHLAEMRLALEPATAALAAVNATEAEIAELIAIARRMDNPAHSRESIARVDLEFHLAIARMSRNPFMRSVSSLIEAALAVSFQLSSPALSREGIAQCAGDHLTIATAIASRDAAAAANAMRVVIDTGLTRTLAALS